MPSRPSRYSLTRTRPEEASGNMIGQRISTLKNNSSRLGKPLQRVAPFSCACDETVDCRNLVVRRLNKPPYSAYRIEPQKRIKYPVCQALYRCHFAAIRFVVRCTGSQSSNLMRLLCMARLTHNTNPEPFKDSRRSMGTRVSGARISHVVCGVASSPPFFLLSSPLFPARLADT